MEEDDPCELTFYNPNTGHYAIFDIKRLRFKKSWQATVYTKMQPEPPPGLKWLKVFGSKCSVEKGSIGFDALWEETITGSQGSHSFEIVVKDSSNDKLYIIFSKERDLYSTREKSESMVEFYNETFPIPNGYEYVMVDYEEDKKYPMAPFLGE